MKFCSCLLLIGLISLFGASTVVGENSPNTPQVFEKWKGSTVQVRVIDKSSGEKSTLGSGFFISDSGLVVTNFHVISSIIDPLEHHRIEVINIENAVVEAQLLNIDVVHDLALLKTTLVPKLTLKLALDPIPIGTRIFSLGNPMELGLTVVEGTYNGYVKESLYKKLRFTGSLNPGMSGGPTILADGSVVGVNVSTLGNDLSFLVPAEYIQSLVDSPPKAPLTLSTVRDQLMENQDGYIGKMLDGPKSDVLCSGNTEKLEKLGYSVTTQTCAYRDSIYLAEKIPRAGEFQYIVKTYSSEDLNQYQFYAMLQTAFNKEMQSFCGEERDFTNFRCKSNLVTNQEKPFRVRFCARAYKRFPGLYDSLLEAVSLSEAKSGVLFSLKLTTLSYETILKIDRAFLENVPWNQ